MRTVIAVVMLLAVGGCSGQQINRLAEQVDGLNGQLNNYLSAAAASGVVDANDLKEIIKASAAISTSTAAIKEGEYITEKDAQNLINAAMAVASSGALGQYGTPIVTILAAISAILGLFAKKKTTEAKTNKAEAENNAKKYAAHKFVVESEIFKEPDLKGGFAKKIYERIGEERAKLGVTV